VKSKALAYVAWITVCLVWGTTYLAIRIALETIPPFLMASFRWLLAGSLLMTALAFRGERLPRARDWTSLGVLGILLIGVGNGGVVWAEQTVPSGMAALLVAGVPFWMVGVERLRADGAPMTPRRLIGLLVGFAGIVLLVWPEVRMGPGGGAFLSGVLATQIACLGWAIGSSYSRRRRDESLLVAAAFQMLFAGVGLLLVGTFTGEWARLAFNGRSLGALMYLVFAGSIVGFTAYAYALKHLTIATVSLYAYVNPVIAVVLGTVFLDEPMTSRIVAASGIVLVGMALVRRAERRAATSVLSPDPAQTS
jgi:drug/metabolite transporter (DMT)-like permease